MIYMYEHMCETGTCTYMYAVPTTPAGDSEGTRRLKGTTNLTPLECVLEFITHRIHVEVAHITSVVLVLQSHGTW